VNDAPVTRDVAYETIEDQSVVLKDWYFSDDRDYVYRGSKPDSPSYLKIVSVPVEGNLFHSWGSGPVELRPGLWLPWASVVGGNLSFQGNQDWFGQTSFNFAVVDSCGLVSETATCTIDVESIPDAPDVSLNSWIVDAEEGRTMALPSGLITLTDVDSANQPVNSLTLNVDGGSLNLSGTRGLVFDYGHNGSGFMSFHGTIENINAALKGLTYKPGFASVGAFTLKISTADVSRPWEEETETLIIYVNGAQLHANGFYWDHDEFTEKWWFTKNRDFTGGQEYSGAAWFDPDVGKVERFLNNTWITEKGSLVGGYDAAKEYDRTKDDLGWEHHLNHDVVWESESIYEWSNFSGPISDFYLPGQLAIETDQNWFTWHHAAIDSNGTHVDVYVQNLDAFQQRISEASYINVNGEFVHQGLDVMFQAMGSDPPSVSTDWMENANVLREDCLVVFYDSSQFTLGNLRDQAQLIAYAFGSSTFDVDASINMLGINNHGNVGLIVVGQNSITATNLATYQPHLKEIGEVLSRGTNAPEFQLWECLVAGNTSTDPTGAAHGFLTNFCQQFGVWNLEVYASSDLTCITIDEQVPAAAAYPTGQSAATWGTGDWTLEWGTGTWGALAPGYNVPWIISRMNTDYQNTGPFF
jgi:hypothetical protein